MENGDGVKVRYYLIIVFSVLLSQITAAYEFCNTTQYVIGFNDRYGFEDLENMHPLNYVREPNQTRYRCDIFQSSGDLEMEINHKSLHIESIDCKFGRIVMNDTTIIDFNDKYAVISLTDNNCINSTTFPFQIPNLQLADQLVGITQNVGIHPYPWTYFTQTHFAPNPSFPTGIFETVPPETRNMIDDLFSSSTMMAPDAYYVKYSSTNMIWIFDRTEKDKIVILGPDYKLFVRGGGNGYLLDLLQLESEQTLNDRSISELKNMDSELEAVEKNIVEWEKLTINTTNIGELETLLDKITTDKNGIARLEPVRQEITTITEHQAVQKALFQSDSYPAPIRNFVHSGVVASSTEIDERIKVLERNMDILTQRVLTLRQNINDKIQFEQYKLDIQQEHGIAINSLIISIAGILAGIVLFNQKYNNLVLDYIYTKNQYKFTWIQIFVISIFLMMFLSLLKITDKTVISFAIGLMISSILLYMVGVSSHVEKTLQKKLIFNWPGWLVFLIIILVSVWGIINFDLPEWSSWLLVILIGIFTFLLAKKSSPNLFSIAKSIERGDQTLDKIIKLKLKKLRNNCNGDDDII